MRCRIAEATERKVKWALKLFNDWKQERNEKMLKDISLQKELTDMNICEINANLSRSLNEIKKQNGDDYPGRTLRDYILALQMHLEIKGRGPFKLLEDKEFYDIRNTLDNIMVKRNENGIGVNVRRAKEISHEDEDIMWQKGILGEDTPQQLLHTIFYLIGKFIVILSNFLCCEIKVGIFIEANCAVDTLNVLIHIFMAENKNNKCNLYKCELYSNQRL